MRHLLWVLAWLVHQQHLVQVSSSMLAVSPLQDLTVNETSPYTFACPAILENTIETFLTMSFNKSSVDFNEEALNELGTILPVAYTVAAGVVCDTCDRRMVEAEVLSSLSWDLVVHVTVKVSIEQSGNCTSAIDDDDVAAVQDEDTYNDTTLVTSTDFERVCQGQQMQLEQEGEISASTTCCCVDKTRIALKNQTDSSPQRPASYPLSLSLFLNELRKQIPAIQTAQQADTPPIVWERVVQAPIILKGLISSNQKQNDLQAVSCNNVSAIFDVIKNSYNELDVCDPLARQITTGWVECDAFSCEEDNLVSAMITVTVTGSNLPPPEDESLFGTISEEEGQSGIKASKSKCSRSSARRKRRLWSKKQHFTPRDLQSNACHPDAMVVPCEDEFEALVAEKLSQSPMHDVVDRITLLFQPQCRCDVNTDTVYTDTDGILSLPGGQPPCSRHRHLEHGDARLLRHRGGPRTICGLFDCD